MREILASVVLLLLLAIDPRQLTASGDSDIAPAARALFGADIAVQAIDDCDDVFAAAHTTGTFVMWTPDVRRLEVCDGARAQRGYLPASTFKLFNALVALDTGAVRDEREVLAWDRVPRARPEWNRDTNLADALRDSTVWFYQEMARRAGPARMREWLERARYGNAQGADAIDHFWLDGELRISALEQLAFLDRLRQGTLPFSARAQIIVRAISERDRGPGHVLHAKAGLTEAHAPALGWYVGWVERDGKPYVFALNVDIHDPVADAPRREALARQFLTRLGALP